MIMAWLTARVGARFARPLFYALCALLLVIVVVIVIKCRPVDHTAERQAEQTNRSGNAIAGAGASAVGVVASGAASEAAQLDKTRQTTKGIENAPDADHIRRTVIVGLCGQKAHSLDPACRLR